MLQSVAFAMIAIWSCFLNRFENSFERPVKIPDIKPRVAAVMDSGNNTTGFPNWAATVVINVVERQPEPIEI